MTYITEELIQQMEKDLQNGSYDLYSSAVRSLSIRMRDGQFFLDGEDFGEFDREFHYIMNAENTRNLLRQLRMRHGAEMDLGTILKKEFGYDDGPWRLQKFCEGAGVAYSTMCL